MQAASQGISVMASSGDDGDNTYTNGSASKARPSADYPASDSQLTSIGGTSLGISSTNSVLFEQAWYDVISRSSGTTWTSKVFYGASGGGKSGITSQPSYQSGIVPSTFSGKPAKRAYPDIANIADSQTGYVVGVTQAGAYTTLTVGGTSLASPYTAGEVALAVQTKGARLGFLNPKLYQNRATAVSDVSGSTVNQGTEGKWKNPSTGAITEPTTYFLNGMEPAHLVAAVGCRLGQHHRPRRGFQRQQLHHRHPVVTRWRGATVRWPVVLPRCRGSAHQEFVAGAESAPGAGRGRLR